MAEDLAKLVVRLEAETARYQKQLDKANKKTERFAQKTKKSLDVVKAAFGAFAIGATLRSITRATAKQEQALAQLDQGLKSTGNAAGFAKEELVGFAEELQKATTFGDEDIINAQANLLTFTNIAGEQFKRTTEAALNLSVRVGQDLKSSVIQLGKALNDPVANLGALSRSGIQFSKDQKEVIKALAESGRLAEAQTIILDELEKQYGGSARAARDTFGGAIEGLQNAFGDLLESKGGLNDAKESIEDFTKVLQDPRTVEGANRITQALVNLVAVIAKGAAEFANFSKFLGEFIAKAAGPAGLDDITDRIAAIKQELEIRSEGGFFDQLNRQIGFVGDSVEELQAELKRLEGTRDFLLDLEDGAPPPPAPSGAPPAPPGPSPGAFPGTFGTTPSAVQSDIDKVRQSLKAQEELVLESYEKRREIILSSTELTGEERNELLRKNEMQAADDLLQEVSVTAEKMGEEIDKIADDSEPVIDKFFGEDAIAFLFADFDNIERRFKELLARMAAEAIAKNIVSLFTGSAGGGIGSFFSGLFGGARAMGGPVSANTAYLVGERGPELFMPSTSGAIVPNSEMTTSSDIQINNFIGEAEVASMMSSPAGKRAILNVVKSEQRTIQALV